MHVSWQALDFKQTLHISNPDTQTDPAFPAILHSKHGPFPSKHHIHWYICLWTSHRNGCTSSHSYTIYWVSHGDVQKKFIDFPRGASSSHEFDQHDPCRGIAQITWLSADKSLAHCENYRYSRTEAVAMSTIYLDYIHDQPSCAEEMFDWNDRDNVRRLNSWHSQAVFRPRGDSVRTIAGPYHQQEFDWIHGYYQRLWAATEEGHLVRLNIDDLQQAFNRRWEGQMIPAVDGTRSERSTRSLNSQLRWILRLCNDFNVSFRRATCNGPTESA